MNSYGKWENRDSAVFWAHIVNSIVCIQIAEIGPGGRKGQLAPAVLLIVLSTAFVNIPVGVGEDSEALPPVVGESPFVDVFIGVC